MKLSQEAITIIETALMNGYDVELRPTRNGGYTIASVSKKLQYKKLNGIDDEVTRAGKRTTNTI